MGIIINDKVFTLHTKNSTYQLKVDDKGVLLHTYYGMRTDETDYSYMIMAADVGFSGNIAAAGDDRTYSLDCFPQEYPVLGSGDYRVNCLEMNLGQGVKDCMLFYDSHKTYSGKYSLSGLPALFAEENDNVETLEIVMKEGKEDVYVHLLYGVFFDDDIITRAVIIENKSGKEICVSRVMSFGVDFARGDYDMIHFHGRHANERNLERVPLFHGIFELRSTRGTSSHQHNPFVILADKNTNEEMGECYGAALVYSGGFHMQTEVDQLEHTRLVMGIDDSELDWKIADGDIFTAPEVMLGYSPNGLNRLSHSYHNAVFKHLIRSVWKDRQRPVLVNNWEATYFDFNAEKLLTIAKHGAELGLDMLVLDDGWFGKRDGDYSGLGDWYVNEKKLGCTLKELVDKVNDMGLSFGIWVEPEMISEDSDLYRAHPDWAFAVPNREPVRGRAQLVLDMTREDVIAYIEEQLFALLDSANIQYMKWDMNRSLAAAYSAGLGRERQGEVRHRFVLGLYRVLEDLHARYPELLIEGCSGGGGRFDMGMLYYTPQIWCSDNTDAIERLRIQYGTSFAYPMSSVSAHVSVCPNHQNGRVTPFKTRGICAMQGTFGYELDLSHMSDEDKVLAQEQVKTFKQHYRLFQFGDYYRIASPFENSDFTAWEYVDKNGQEAYVAVVFTDVHGNPLPKTVRLKGLVPDAVYKICRDGNALESHTGAALMNAGLLLPTPETSYDSTAFYICMEE